LLHTGIGHFIPLVAYIGFWVMCLVSLGGRPLWGLYYLIPFIPYRTMRNHFGTYPLGGSMLTILVVTVIIAALMHGKRLPKSKLYLVWFVFGGYLYLSMWMGAALGNAPYPIWSPELNFIAWKAYMLIPLIFLATCLVVEDRKAVRTVILITAISLFFIDRSVILENLTRSWGHFDEDKRDVGPLAYGSNQTAAFLAQFAMFFWGFLQFIKRKKFKLMGYTLVAATLFGTMYEFSRGAYLAVLVSVLVLGIMKDRKLLVILGLFLFTWQAVVPVPVRQRVMMTHDSSGQLEASAQERVDLWSDAEKSILADPIFGNGFATYQYGQHVANLENPHNWYVQVLVETGVIGLIIALILVQQMFSVSYRLFKRARDPMYQGLGLGLFIAMCCSVVSNSFGDRWTYLEIMGMLWVLVGAAVRADQLRGEEVAPEVTVVEPDAMLWLS
jgi:putative inorganic carbon (hco3(-)) transporter